MSDGKVVIETDLDNSGIKKGLATMGGLASKGAAVATKAVVATGAALGGVATAAVKVGADFEAQMSRVKAISGATGADFEALRQQAIQLGADTAFSASSAAEGMENLAAAGFATAEIMDAMPGMLALAAASGEDLASSSDIAASTLRGFGLAASEAGHVADVLAENANRTNSSVSETGEAMKFVAPLARAAGISMEETAAAIGIMANAGIQGSQAGTTLRGALSRLSKPTADMQRVMDELGISFYDSNGKMKSLADQVGMLKAAMAGMTDEQKNNYLVTLYGQESLSGMLALMNEGEGALADLTESYRNCDGAAQEAADTMQDNLAGAVEQLKGSAETLGIAFYDSVSTPLKDAAQAATESVNQITTAFNNGGIEAAVAEAGNQFASLSTEAASHAPEMAEAAVGFIQSFVGGIVDNRGRLIAAAGEAALAVAHGFAELLPEKLRKPVEEAIDGVADSLSSGGLKSGAKSAISAFESVIDVTGDLAGTALPVLVDVLDFAGDHMELLAATAGTAFTAFKGYKAISTASSIVSKGAKAWQTASKAVDAYNVIQMACTAQGVISNATLKTGQAAVGLLTGRVTLATAAQSAWNVVMNANPIAIVITAVAALAAGIAIYTATQDNSVATMERANQKLHEQAEAIRDTQTARQEEVDGINQSYAQYQALWTELQGIVDQNGKVKKGYEDRAAFITSTLAEATGQEITITDGVIDKYGELCGSIEEVIEKKRQEAILAAYEDSYTEAIKNRVEAQNTLAEKSSQLEEAQKKLAEAEKAAEDAGLNAATAGGKYGAAISNAESEVRSAEQALRDAKTATDEYSTTAANYEAAMGAIESGSDNAGLAILRLETNMKTAANSTEAELQKQVDTMAEQYEAMKSKAAQGIDGVTQETVAGYEAMMLAAQYELASKSGVPAEELESMLQKAKEALARSDLAGAAMGATADVGEAAAEGIEGGKTEVEQATKETITEGVKDGAASADTSSASTAGSDVGETAAEGIKDGESSVSEATKETITSGVQNGAEAADAAGGIQGAAKSIVAGVADSIKAGSSEVGEATKGTIEAGASAGASAADTSSMSSAGSNMVQALTSAIIMLQQTVYATAQALGLNVNMGLGAANMSGNAMMIGTGAVSALSYSLYAGTWNANYNANMLGYSANMGIQSANMPYAFQSAGTGAVGGLTGGLMTGSGLASARAYSLGASANGGIRSANMPGTFGSVASGAGAAVKNNLNKSASGVSGAAAGIGLAASSGITKVGIGSSFQATGSEAGASLATSIQGQGGGVTSSARVIGTGAIQGLKAANMKTGAQSEGIQFGQSLATGIRSGGTAARSAASSIGASAKSALSGMAAAGRSLGLNFSSGFAAGISAGRSQAIAAASSVAADSLAAAKRKLDVNSPSKETEWIGEMFDAGAERGITKGANKPVAAVEKMADKMIGAMDMSMVAERMRSAMAINTGRIAKGISSTVTESKSGRQQTTTSMKLSDEDLEKIGQAFGRIAAEILLNGLDGMSIGEINKRELFRIIREGE